MSKGADLAFAFQWNPAARIGTRVADTAQIAVMRQALNDHCHEFGIDGKSAVRKDIALRILLFYSFGIAELNPLKVALRADRNM